MRICAILGLISSLLLTGCAPGPGQSSRSYQMGEKIQLGKLIYIIFDTQWLTQLGQGPAARIPESRFFLVRLSVTNSGSSEATVPTFSIIDDSGKTYRELMNGQGFPLWIGFLRTLQPVDTLQGNAIFDAPPGHYRLKLSDDAEQASGYVDIPLTFSSESPEIPAPEPVGKQ